VEEIDENNEIWIRQKISFDASYGNERVIVYLFLPKNSEPPYQTVVYFPGAGATNISSFAHVGIGAMEFIPKTGRALLYPIYKSTYERRDGYAIPPENLASWHIRVGYWYQDLARSLDYLTTRLDVDPEKLAFFGWSWGAQMGSIYLALEHRFKAGILIAGGFLLIPESRE